MSKICFHKREKRQEKENLDISRNIGKTWRRRNEGERNEERNEKKTLGYKSFWPKGRNIWLEIKRLNSYPVSNQLWP